jgi:hypothetical protein
VESEDMRGTCIYGVMLNGALTIPEIYNKMLRQERYMATEVTSLRANKKSISSLLKEIKGHKFIIPDYQRPYKWEIDKCDVLWNDIVENSILPDEYFFGTIVTYVNQDNNCEIIDGQQRITSFYLL